MTFVPVPDELSVLGVGQHGAALTPAPTALTTPGQPLLGANELIVRLVAPCNCLAGGERDPVGNSHVDANRKAACIRLGLFDSIGQVDPKPAPALCDGERLELLRLGQLAAVSQPYRRQTLDSDKVVLPVGLHHRGRYFGQLNRAPAAGRLEPGVSRRISSLHTPEESLTRPVESHENAAAYLRRNRAPELRVVLSDAGQLLHLVELGAADRERMPLVPIG